MYNNKVRKSNNSIKNKDVADGKKCEAISKTILENYLGISLLTTDWFSISDFSNPMYEIELKKRNVKHKTYADTMIGQNKLDYMKKQMAINKTCIFAFHFTDGLYIIKLDEENIKTIKENKYGGRKDRGYNEFKKSGYCYIPIDQLVKIN
tara:strand:- start:9411 stop:9860 length:450 start_codon:yes stop_codon:yes gene_type:complete